MMGKDDAELPGRPRGARARVSEAGNGPVDPRIQSEIGKHLRAIYDGVVNEPVPPRFMELLEKLERSRKS